MKTETEVCYKCNHTKMAHTQMVRNPLPVDRNGKVTHCFHAECKCKKFELFPEAAMCTCKHAYRIHGDTKGVCLIKKCQCRHFTYASGPKNLQKFKIPQIQWSNYQFNGNMIEFRPLELNVFFDIINGKDEKRLRFKSLEMVGYQEIIKIKEVDEANIIVYNFMIQRIKKASKVIGLTEFNGKYPHLDWKLAPLKEETWKLDLTDSFGTHYLVHKAGFGTPFLVLTKNTEFYMKSVVGQGCDWDFIDKLVFDDIKSCIRRGVKRLGLLKE